jgi:hypothetical protein
MKILAELCRRDSVLALWRPTPQATACNPFRATRVSNFNAAPLGCFSPRSHWRTSPVVTFKCSANTAWDAFSRRRSARISSGESGSTGVRQSASKPRKPRLSIAPASASPCATSCTAASASLLYPFGIAHHLRHRSIRHRRVTEPPQGRSNSSTSATRHTLSRTEIQIALAISIASAMPGLYPSKPRRMMISLLQKPIATAAPRRGPQRLMPAIAL